MYLRKKVLPDDTLYDELYRDLFGFAKRHYQFLIVISISLIIGLIFWAVSINNPDRMLISALFFVDTFFGISVLLLISDVVGDDSERQIIRVMRFLEERRCLKCDIEDIYEKSNVSISLFQVRSFFTNVFMASITPFIVTILIFSNNFVINVNTLYITSCVLFLIFYMTTFLDKKKFDVVIQNGLLRYSRRISKDKVLLGLLLAYQLPEEKS